MKKIFIICVLITLNLSVFAKKPGDYIEIGGIPAVVFHTDSTGEHGLALSRPAFRVDKFKEKDIQKLVDDSILTQEQADKLTSIAIDMKSYKKAGKLKKKEKEKLFTDLVPMLTDNGEENMLAIQQYCKDKNLSLKDNFPWQYWATQLGEGWYIPGDYELELLATYYYGGLNKKLGIFDCANKTTEFADKDHRVFYIIRDTGIGFYTQGNKGVISSTAKHPKHGFRFISKEKNGWGKEWCEIFDYGLDESELATCAVHKF